MPIKCQNRIARTTAVAVTSACICASAAMSSIAADTASAPSVAFGGGPIPFDEIAAVATAKKDQFETSPDFEKRTCEATAKLLKVKPKESIVFRISGTTNVYDADRQQFSAESPTDAGTRFGPYLQLAARARQKPDYVGSNAYGVSRRVTNKESDYVVVVFTKRLERRRFEIKVPSKTENARVLAGDMRLELVTRMASFDGKCVGLHVNQTEPTISAPNRETRFVHMLYADPSTSVLRVVRVSTGEILATAKP
jgi:hypothetical protein